MRRIGLPTRQLWLLTIVLIGVTAQADDAASEAGVTPYRPSVSSPAQLPLAGQLEFELGGLASKTDDVRRDSLPYQFKLAFNTEWGILLGGEAYVSARDDLGNRDRGIGDTSLVLKRAFAIDDATAFGLEFGAKLPTAKDTIGSGKTDYTVNSIFSRDIGSVHMDVNLNVTSLGAIELDTARTQTGYSASFSMPLTDKWGANAELSGTRRAGVPSMAQFLLAGTYSPSKKMTFDVGMAIGLNGASPDWSIFGGMVIPVAKFW